MINKMAVALFAIIMLSGCGWFQGANTTSCGGNNTTCGASKEEYTDHSQHLKQFKEEVGDHVLFALNSSAISQKAADILMRQAEWLKDHKLFGITVEGHCDDRGTREFNIALGERRAEAVKMFLVKQGVDADRIDTISYGKERPAVMGNNEDAWKQNRRGVTAIK